jgi:hypothetical protein
MAALQARVTVSKCTIHSERHLQTSENAAHGWLQTVALKLHRNWSYLALS